MFTVAGYDVSARIYEGNRSFVYRATRRADGVPVVLKILRSEFPSVADTIHLRNEFDTLRRVAGASRVVEALAFDQTSSRAVLILEDFGAGSLRDWMAGPGAAASLEDKLRIAVDVVDAIGQLHELQVIHKDVNPSNVLYAADTGTLKICDLDLSTVLSRETPDARSPADIEGTLAYISPEQTGRMNRPVDYRTDFYSFGATLYELLTGQVPFKGSDPLELVHCHLARQPVAPHDVDACVPQVVSDIVMRLLAKTAEDRYQSSFGIRTDLAQCVALLHDTGNVSPFPIAQHDVSERFELPRRLYGRDGELAALLATSVSASQPDARASLVLVTGYAGIGKSMLVQELYRPITARRGYFTAGKYDQFQRATPYSAFAVAFRSLVRQLLGESDRALAAWREKLLTALGPNGGVVTQLVPDLALIIGEQPAPPELGPTELRNRFGIVLRSFIGVFAKPEHPLTLFLDDLQWADSASLNLIDLVLRDDQPQCLLVVGAYRDREVSDAHPLALMLGALERDGVSATRISLGPLSTSDVTHIVADATDRTTEDSAPLAMLIASKTEGNPLFVSEMLKSVYQDGLLAFDRRSGTWKWDLGEIEARGITNNVVDLMIGNLRKLPTTAQRMLQLAACIGSSFDIETLAVIAETTPSAAFELLLPAVQAGYVTASSRAPGAQRGDDASSALRVRDFRFLHDRVQQAAYALIPDDERDALHLRIGRRLLAEREVGERFFDAVDHLNRGRSLIDSEAGLRELVQLDLEAGRRARRAVAYSAARSYLDVAHALLAPDVWETDYALAAAVHEELAAASALDGAHDRAEELLTILIDRAESPVAQANAHVPLVSLYTLLSRYDEALAACKRGAALLGMDVPVDDAPDQIQAALGPAFGEVMEKLAGRPIPSLVDAPEMTDPSAGTLVVLLQSVLATSYFKSPLLYSLIVFKAVRILLEYGPTPRSPEFFVYHGHVVGGVMGDSVSGYQFGRLAVDLSERFAVTDVKCRTCFMLANFISPWTQHLRESRTLNEAGYLAALETGDLLFAGYCLLHRAYNALFDGRPLDELVADLPGFLGFSRRSASYLAIDFMVGLDMVLRNLRGLTASVSEFRTADMDEASYLAGCVARGSTMALATYPVAKAEALYLHDEPRTALRVLTESEALVPAIMGTIATAFHPFYTALCMAELYPTADDDEKIRYRERIDATVVQFQRFAQFGPDNFAHLLAILSAEVARLDGRLLDAGDLYDQAIDRAKASGFEQHAAMACERAATLLIARGRERAARAYLAEALNGWQVRGSHRKVELLRSRYAELLDPGEGGAGATSSSGGSEPRGSQSARASRIDVASIVKATQAISGEIVLDELLRRIMHIVLENAGAQRGALIFHEGDDLVVRVNAHVIDDTGTPVVGIVSGTPLAQYAGACEEIIRYVARTREPVILRDATKEAPFAGSAYVMRTAPRSVLAIPVVHQGSLLGVLYLENALTTGAFTESRVDFLRMLSAQAAISLQNARLYESLKSRNDELARTHEALRRFVPVEYLKLLGHKSITDVRRGDQTQLDVSVLFSDIRGFTTLSESLGLAETFRFINDYLACVEPEIHGNHGLVNQYYGDGVMALFPASADDALRAAAGMFRGLARFNETRRPSGSDPIQIAVGVNSGLVTLGTIGGGDHLACTVTGDAVNLASRIEGISRLFGASILVAEDTVARLREPASFALRAVGRVLPKGKTRPVTVFETLDAEPPAVRERRVASAGAIRGALALWQRAEFAAAGAAFGEILQRDATDPTAAMYFHECARLAKSAPPPGWDGVFRLDSK